MSSIGANVIAVDIGDAKLKIARESGAVATVNNSLDNPVEAIMEITKGGSDVSVDALGITAACENAILGLRKRGRHLQIGLTTRESDGKKGFISVPIDMIVEKETQIIRGAGMPTSHYQDMFKLIDSVDIKINKLVTERVTLEQASDVIVPMNQYSNIGIPVVGRF